MTKSRSNRIDVIIFTQVATLVMVNVCFHLWEFRTLLHILWVALQHLVYLSWDLTHFQYSKSYFEYFFVGSLIEWCLETVLEYFAASWIGWSMVLWLCLYIPESQYSPYYTALSWFYFHWSPMSMTYYPGMEWTCAGQNFGYSSMSGHLHQR